MLNQELIKILENMPKDAEIRDYEGEVIDGGFYNENTNTITLW